MIGLTLRPSRSNTAQAVRLPPDGPAKPHTAATNSTRQAVFQRLIPIRMKGTQPDGKKSSRPNLPRLGFTSVFTSNVTKLKRLREVTCAKIAHVPQTSK